MLGVSMGMTSEEPITHLEWFDGLLRQHGLPDPGRQIQVMTLPGSYLDRFARARGSRTAPIQLDGENHTPGRMSAPATRVFLRPVALMLAAHGAPGALPAVLRRGQDLYRLRHGLPDTTRRALTRDDPFSAPRRLARAAGRGGTGSGRGRRQGGAGDGEGGAEAAGHPAPRLGGLRPLAGAAGGGEPGEGRQGLPDLLRPVPGGALRAGLRRAADRRGGVRGAPGRAPGTPGADPARPGGAGPRGRAEGPAGGAAGGGAGRGAERETPAAAPGGGGLGELAGLFLGFKKTVAGYGYLQDIVYAGQPAVEAYKKYARDLREAPGPVRLDAGASGRSGGRWRSSRGPWPWTTLPWPES